MIIMAALFCALIFLSFHELTVAQYAPNEEGSFLTWQANNSDPAFYPMKRDASKVKVHVTFTRRWEDLKNPCKGSSAPHTCSSASTVPLFLFFGSSILTQRQFLHVINFQFSCPYYPYDNPIVYGYSEFALVMERNSFYKIRYSSCCLSPTLQSYSSSSINQEMVISLSLSYKNKVNSPVQMRRFPKFTIPNDREITTHLPVYDPDGDAIVCRWAENYEEGGSLYRVRMGVLDKENCDLRIDGSKHKPGKYGLVVLLEDFKRHTNFSVKHHSVSVQFVVEITGPVHEQKQEVNCSHISLSPIQLPQLVSYPEPVFPTPRMRPYISDNDCTSYKNLSSNDRSILYSDWSSYRCDMLLYGWYRFTGQSGLNILSTCPVGYSKASCGTDLKGWLKDQTMPSFEDGVVDRSVCFSKHDSCNCTFRRDIKVKNCGRFFIYFLDAVPKCNARYCGKADFGGTITCFPNFMRIDFDEARYDSKHYASITLREPSCVPYKERKQVILGTGVDECGTNRKETKDHLIFENQVIFKPKGTGIISRDEDIRIKFSCAFLKNNHLKLGVIKQAHEVNIEEPVIGKFSLVLSSYSNGNFQTKHKKFPVTVSPSSRIHFEASSSATTDFAILLDNCYSTEKENPHVKERNTIIRESCSVGRSVTFHTTSRSKQRFSIPASELLSKTSKVHLHCVLFLCHFQSNHSRCNTGCSKERLSSIKSDSQIASTVSNYYLLTLGPIEKGKSQSKGHNLTLDLVSYILIMVVAIAVNAVL